MGRPIIDPNRDHRTATQAAAEQTAAGITHALAQGFAKSLANQLAKLTMSDGPWLLHRDGTVTWDNDDNDDDQP